MCDLTNPIGCNLISVLVLTNALGRNLIYISSWSYQSTWPQTNISTCSYKPSQVPSNTLDTTLLGRTFFNSPKLFLFSIYTLIEHSPKRHYHNSGLFSNQKFMSNHQFLQFLFLKFVYFKAMLQYFYVTILRSFLLLNNNVITPRVPIIVSPEIYYCMQWDLKISQSNLDIWSAKIDSELACFSESGN